MKVIPAAKGEQRPFLGPALVPMRVDGSDFLLKLVGSNWLAQLEAARLAEALVSTGAVGAHRETWSLLCSEHYAYLGPVGLPNRIIAILVLELGEAESGS